MTSSTPYCWSWDFFAALSTRVCTHESARECTFLVLNETKRLSSERIKEYRNLTVKFAQDKLNIMISFRTYKPDYL
jgi:hypothetical protein